MTADESGLPPLDPDELSVPEINTGGELMKWLIRTVLALPDVTDEQRDEFISVVRNITFTNIMKDVSASMVEDLIAEQIDRLDWENARPQTGPPKDDHDEGEPPA